jgi:hypothetical protein
MGDAIRESVDLTLLEAAAGGIFNPDGSVNVVLMRPCAGRGPGARIYSRELLERSAEMFSSWPSYQNHPDMGPARRLRRRPEELAGELRETRWDPSLPGPSGGSPRWALEPAPSDAPRWPPRTATHGRPRPAPLVVTALRDHAFEKRAPCRVQGLVGNHRRAFAQR